MLQRTIATLTLLSIGACGGDGGVAVPETDAEACEAVPGCSEPAVPATEETAPIWRVLIERTESGDVRIDRFEEIATPAADGTPIGPSDGSHALVALDASPPALTALM